jgi:uncharacterized protein YjiS (DUF1127 family)
MLTATVMEEIGGRERRIRCPADIQQYQQRGRYLHAPQWRRLLKGMAGSLRRAFGLGACYAWRAPRIATDAIARERQRSAYRRALQALNASTLKDIGLHRGEIPWALSALSTTDKLSRLSAWSVQHRAHGWTH